MTEQNAEKEGRCAAPTEVLTFGDEAWMECGCGERLALPITTRDDGSRYVKGIDHSIAWEGHIAETGYIDSYDDGGR